MTGDPQPDPQPDDATGVSPDLLAQLRGVLDRLSSVATNIPGVSRAAQHLPELPAVPAPGGMSAAQVAAIVSTVHAQRATIDALRTNLDAFEQQLIVLEQLLEPLQSLTRAWADLERRVVE